MKSYLDAGIFVDYFVHQGVLAPSFRSAPRRGRSPDQLGEDAITCFERLAARQTAITSALTPYELEEATYGALRRSGEGAERGSRAIIRSARSVATQTLMATELFAIRLLNVTHEIMTAVTHSEMLQSRGIRAADAIHVITALHARADLLITADRTMLSLDGIFAPLRCVDTDEALRLLA